MLSSGLSGGHCYGGPLGSERLALSGSATVLWVPLESVGGLGGMEDSPGRRVLYRALGSSLLMGGSQSPALGIRGSQS